MYADKYPDIPEVQQQRARIGEDMNELNDSGGNRRTQETLDKKSTAGCRANSVATRQREEEERRGVEAEWTREANACIRVLAANASTSDNNTTKSSTAFE